MRIQFLFLILTYYIYKITLNLIQMTKKRTINANASSGGLESFIKSKDQFGKGIPWNMNGAGQFKTLPGGIISIVFDIVYWSYFLICLNQMVNKTTWKLTT